MNLENELHRLEKIFFSDKCNEQKEELSKISKEVEKTIEEKLPLINKRIPDAILLNEFEMEVSLSDLTGNGNTLIFFYRGSWCPYSNVNVEYLMNQSEELKSRGFNIIVVSNSLPDKKVSLYERVNLPISVLSDTRCNLAKTLGITYELSPYLKELYTKANIFPDLGESQKIIFPTMFITDKNLDIIDTFITDDEVYFSYIDKLLSKND